MKTIAPEQLSEDTRKLFDVLNAEGDLPCVVVAAAFLDSSLATLLTARLQDAAVARRLLAPEAPLGSYAARTDLAYSLGLVTKNQYNDLRMIGRIRNRFAHSHLGLSFQDPAIQQLCGCLNEWRVIPFGKEEENIPNPTPEHEQLRREARNKFNLTVAFVANWVLMASLSEKRRKASSKPRP